MRWLAILGLPAICLAIYLLLIRPWQIHWGATVEEVSASLPGDELIASPSFVFTRAITVDATPDEVWPWIIQMGYKRAGFYSYDWFDNRGRRSAEQIIDSLQELIEGDRIPISGLINYQVAAIDSPHTILWVSNDEPLNGTWLWSLTPAEDGKTRLVTRISGSFERKLPDLLYLWALDVGDFPFMRKSMLGVKQRAEQDIRDSYALDVVEGAIWASSFLQFLIVMILLLKREQWIRFWTLGLGIAFVFMATFYLRPHLILLLLLQLTTLGLLMRLYRRSART